MKWFNKDKTQMIDLSKVDSYTYYPAGQYQEKNGSYIEFVINGYSMTAKGTEADEIYNILKSKRELLLEKKEI